MELASRWRIVQRFVFLGVVVAVAAYTKPQKVDILVEKMVASPILGLGGLIFVVFVTLTARGSPD